jgi:hypothetical protein
MFNLHYSDILQHWSVTHALAVQRVNDRTLREMRRLPPHLLEDVNAQGLVSAETDRSDPVTRHEDSANVYPLRKPTRGFERR